ncbi:class I SAM-dependent methyltransferase [Humitalea sp. 24SJ18S-53]|uniref:class I SAM-dependent methyltransferase n=1 Tax=Humitalea sp. 24SJ18S-53 TaxID=3422307 RepID=UPI003D6738A5
MDDRLSRPQQARLDFVESIKHLVATRLTPQLRRDYELWAAGKPEALLRDHAVMEARFGHDPVYQAGRGLARISQEAMWRQVRAGYEPRRAEIEARLDQPPAGVSLRLAPDLVAPAYFTDTEFHLQTGGFHAEKLAGLIYETGVATYSMHRYGKRMDEMGRALLSVLPKRDYKRILYLGCGPGYKGYPIQDAFPGADFHAADISAPMLRYAAQRAASHGRDITFHQTNAEAPDLPEGTFDLVFCILLLHEIPIAAIRNVVHAAHRLLAPGGVLANAELPSYAAVDPLSAYLLDWDTDHNGEPFWRDYHALDLEGLYREVGFTDVHTGESVGAGGQDSKAYVGRFRYHITLGTKAGDDAE